MSVYSLKWIDVNTLLDITPNDGKVEELKNEFTRCLRGWNTHYSYFGLNEWKENLQSSPRARQTHHNNFMNDVYLWIEYSSQPFLLFVCVGKGKRDRATIVDPSHATHNQYGRVSVYFQSHFTFLFACYAWTTYNSWYPLWTFFYPKKK